MKNLIGIEDLTSKDIMNILRTAKEIEQKPSNFQKILQGKSLATVFFQQSTRTQAGFSLAMQKLGGDVISINSEKYEHGMSKCESFEDTIRVIGDYVDVICLRHELESAPVIAAKTTNSKIINCGNGVDQHPTQALIDLYAILKCINRLDNLNVAIVGGLKNSRSAHSLAIALSSFSNNHVTLISPQSLGFSNEYIQKMKRIEVTQSTGLGLESMDIVYMAGLTEKDASKKIREKYQLNLERMSQLKKNPFILSPLPRIDEITTDVDKLSNAVYFQQSKDSIFVRMAILKTILT